MPGDVIVGDAEGVVVVPAHSPRRSRSTPPSRSSIEQFAFERVNAGESTSRLFPLADERRAEYEAWREPGDRMRIRRSRRRRANEVPLRPSSRSAARSPRS